MKQTSVKGFPSNACLVGTSDVSAVGSIPTGNNFIFCRNFLKPLHVNSSLKCKFDLIVKNLNDKLSQGRKSGFDSRNSELREPQPTPKC